MISQSQIPVSRSSCSERAGHWEPPAYDRGPTHPSQELPMDKEIAALYGHGQAHALVLRALIRAYPDHEKLRRLLEEELQKSQALLEARAIPDETLRGMHERYRTFSSLLRTSPGPTQGRG